MNAGAYGGEMADVLREVTCCDFDGNLYRFSRMSWNSAKDQPGKEGRLHCPGSPPAADPEKPTVIRAKMKELKPTAAEKQPLNLPSAEAF